MSKFFLDDLKKASADTYKSAVEFLHRDDKYMMSEPEPRIHMDKSTTDSLTGITIPATCTCKREISINGSPTRLDEISNSLQLSLLGFEKSIEFYATNREIHVGFMKKKRKSNKSKGRLRLEYCIGMFLDSGGVLKNNDGELSGMQIVAGEAVCLSQIFAYQSSVRNIIFKNTGEVTLDFCQCSGSKAQLTLKVKLLIENVAASNGDTFDHIVSEFSKKGIGLEELLGGRNDKI